ncbi:MAG: hypothetical protein DRJ51_04850 [Thermoprotei archaeon]|nr:MAG: hypothetical protein DRJ51_04850 [Thermoprotei archaeon]RLF02487.1 MAG: hypothetical protein DRJ59_03460 [Thermoprotei archaeon]
MRILPVKKPTSGGIILSYKCTGECRHCMYACSPKWSDYWIPLTDLKVILEKLVEGFSDHDLGGIMGVNVGLHFTGGEPFLNYPLLLEAVRIASRLGFPLTFVETNCSWCINEDLARKHFQELKEAGLDGMLVSANPFVVEHVPFENISRALRIATEVFGANKVIVYHPLFYESLKSLGVKGRISFEDYWREMVERNSYLLALSFSPSIVLPMGRLPYRLGHLYKRMPARAFFNENCLAELTRPWHIHVDCYCNYIPGYCAGISLGDARELESIIAGVEVEDRPILKALASSLRELYEFAVKEYGYKEDRYGYVSKCHLCVDIRRHIVERTREFKELKPEEFYQHL